MPYTRGERCIIEEIIKRLVTIDNKLLKLEQKVKVLEEALGTEQSKLNFLDFTDEEIANFIAGAVEKLADQTIPIHDHTSDKKGGDAFAAKGANLL